MGLSPQNGVASELYELGKVKRSQMLNSDGLTFQVKAGPEITGQYPDMPNFSTCLIE
jgi:hypothetical protein